MRSPGSWLAIALLALTGCTVEEGNPHAPATVSRVLPWAPEALAAAPEPEANPTTPIKAELGRLLFYDPILSTDRAVACATCHSEIWGMSDGLARSIGVGGVGPTGPGRVGKSLTRRNAQTLWNVAHRETLFWDGRTGSLEDQVIFPLHEARELGRDPAEVVADIAAIPDYAARFAEAFPGAEPAVSVIHLQQAIAAFERTMVSDRSPYDQFIAGDEGALSAEAQRGMWLFAEVGCAKCHVPPRFEAEVFADRHVAPIAGVRDEGRGAVTRVAVDQYAFRVPTLRNVRESGPYFHTGAVEELLDAVRHEAELAPRALDEDEISAITTFLDKGLVDPSRSPGRPAKVPSGLPVPVDGFRIPR
ncbi:Cytochrome c551 peroxidase [Minicystis rosea]|nr:Cytochrome c551 peroxidase [Minicystis rosea]